MDDPISKDESVSKFRKKNGLIDTELTPSILGRVMIEKMMASAGLESLLQKKTAYEQPAESKRLDKEADQFVEQHKREKLEQEKIAARRHQSDSDSDVEARKKNQKKKQVKKRQSEVRNMRRKTGRESINTESVTFETAPMDEDFFTKKPDNESKEPSEAEHKRKRKTKNTIIDHPTLTDRELQRFTEKELQSIDSKVNADNQENQKTYYLSKKQRTHLPYGSMYIGTETIAEDEPDELQNGLHSLGFDYTVQDMDMILNKLKAGIKTWVPETTEVLLQKLANCVELVTRAEEDANLRIPRKELGERNCGRDEECEGMKIVGAKPVILMERLTKSQKMTMMNGNGKLPVTRGLCVMCMRFITMYYYINIRAECISVRKNTILSNFGNITDKAGEYLLEQCIMDSTDNQGLPVPVVMHCKYYYKQVISGNMIYYQQVGYPKPEEYASYSGKEKELLFP